MTAELRTVSPVEPCLSVWDSDDVDEHQRVAAIRSMLRDRLTGVDVGVPGAGADAIASTDASARVACWSLGLAQVVVVSAGPAVVERRMEDVKADARPTLFVVVPHGPRSVVRRGDRELVLRPGGLVVYDSGVPFTHEFLDGVVVDVLALPVERLGVSQETIDAVAALDLIELTPLARVVRHLFADLAAHPPSSIDELSVTGPAIDLLRATLEAAAGQVAPARRDRLADTIIAFVLANLADPALDAQTIARSHHISERHLYAVLARAGIHLSRFIQERRLHHVGVALLNPAAIDVPIGVLARRHGFVSASHFSRRFRERYGVTPRQWRKNGRTSFVREAGPGSRELVRTK